GQVARGRLAIAGLGDPLRLAAVGVHLVDLLVPVAGGHEGDAPAVGRDVGRPVAAGGGGEGPGVASVSPHAHELRNPAARGRRVDDAGAVGSPHGLALAATIDGDAARVAAVGVHHVQVEAAA